MRSATILVFSWATAALAQQIYAPADGPVARPTKCSVNGSYATASPVYSFSQFSFTQTETVRTATSVTPGPATTYAPPYESLSHLVPDLATTTWGNWYPNATVAATDSGDPYGQAAWSAIWERVNLANFTDRGIYSTTVSPTPVPTSELVLPPPSYFQPQDTYYFPNDFEFGVAGSASQIEGAIADEGRTPTLMEIVTMAFSPSDPTNYVTNENYYLYKQDIERLAAMGVKYYSFSIPWSRILPFALEGTPVNKQGLDHYEDLINFTIEKGMVPHVTLIHFDTPLQFYDDPYNRSVATVGSNNGGYSHPKFQDAFVHYGKVVMTHFADRVPVWYTFNEPLLYCDNGKAVDTVIKAHARLFHFYHEEIKGAGRVSIKFNDNFGVPRNPADPKDVEAANHFNEYQLATFANPIFLGKDYPEAYKMTIPDYVPLTAEDLAYLNGTADFLGIDPYTATETNATTGWNIGYRSESYVYMTPTYLRTYLNYLWNTFRKPVTITEFGFPVFHEAEAESLSDQLYDQPRSDYYVQFLGETLKAIWEDGVHVAGAFAWSFADNWEFGDYDQHFGIQTVNRTTMERRYKKSFFDVVDFVAARTQ
ncbi:glycoside hydrolase family 1 protein [Apiospora saccharicola]|uniref:Glycoside hydrolase family 1 protein n=1 Tax=Apiospora saccharicola TaxID=335842 RepID=A0ABR1UWM8_9PEZI